MRVFQPWSLPVSWVTPRLSGCLSNKLGNDVTPHSLNDQFMQSAITRLALFQFLVVFYSVLGVGLIVKLRFGSPAPQIFATHLRDYGFLLLLLPAGWLTWA